MLTCLATILTDQLVMADNKATLHVFKTTSLCPMSKKCMHVTSIFEFTTTICGLEDHSILNAMPKGVPYKAVKFSYLAQVTCTASIMITN